MADAPKQVSAFVPTPQLRVSPCECKRIKRNGLHLSAAQASVAKPMRAHLDAIHCDIHLSWPIERWTCVGSRGRRDAMHGASHVRVPDVHGYRQSRAVTRSRVGGFGSARTLIA